MRHVSCLVLFRIVVLATVVTAAVDGHASDVPQPPMIDVAVRHVLLDPDTPDAERATALQAVVALASDGSSDAAFQLGVLYRSGPAHPAKATPRDPDTARHWLERCVAQAGCPLMALAALAELELAEDRPEQAMQWAQASALAEREIGLRRAAKGEAQGNSPISHAYHAALLRRVFIAMPNSGDNEARAGALLRDWLAEHEQHLLRLIDAELDPPPVPPQFRVEFDPESTKDLRIPRGPVANYALFLLRSTREGGRSDSALMIDGLPSPREAKPLASVARSLRFRSWTPVDGETIRYSIAPMVLDDGRFELQQQVTSGG